MCRSFVDLVDLRVESRSHNSQVQSRVVSTQIKALVSAWYIRKSALMGKKAKAAADAVDAEPSAIEVGDSRRKQRRCALTHAGNRAALMCAA